MDNEKEYNDFMHKLAKAASMYIVAFVTKYNRAPTESEVDSYTDGVMFTLAMYGIYEEGAAYIAAKLQDSMMQAIQMETHTNKSPEVSAYEVWIRNGGMETV